MQRAPPLWRGSLHEKKELSKGEQMGEKRLFEKIGA